MEHDESDFSDGDEDYDALYRNSQAAISQSKSNQYESRALQDELLDYMDDLDHRKGSDGKALIKVPSNFNSIVESMNREDLATTKSDEKPWSQYLLLDSLNSEFDTEYNGRYTQAFDDTPDVKIARGLAQIQLLDRQLQEAARKSKSIATDHSESGSPRHDDELEDPTFVTAGKRRAGAGAGAEPSPRIDSARRGSEKHRPKFSSKATSKPKESADAARQKQRLELLTSDLGEEVDLQEQLGAYLDPQLEQQCRDIDAQLMQFGRLDLLQGEGDQPERELEQGEAEGNEGHSQSQSQLQGGASNSHKLKHSSRPPDYLAEQRKERAERDRAQRIDKMLEAVIAQPIQYEALLDDGGAGSDGLLSAHAGSALRSARSTIGSPAGTRVDPLEVPSPRAVNPEKVVTAGDIQELLRVLSAPSHPHSKSTWRSQSQFGSAHEDTPSHLHEEGFSASPGGTCSYTGTGSAGSGLQLRPVDKDAVRALVQQYKRDVEALGRVRRCSQMRRITSAMAGASAGSAAEAGSGSGSGSGSGADAGFSRPGSAVLDASPQQRANERSNPSSPDERSPRMDSLIYKSNKQGSENGSHRASLSSGLLDMSEVAPQSFINMAHPALGGNKQKVETASSGAGSEGALPVPVPPLGAAAGPHPHSSLPLSPDPHLRSGGGASAGRRSLAQALALDGWQESEEAQSSARSSHSQQRRTPKSLRLAPHSPSSPGPAPARALGGSIGSDLLMARNRGGAGHSGGAPQSVFRAFHSDGLDDSLLAGITRMGRLSPRSTQRIDTVSNPGPSTSGNGFSAVQQQRRALKASNVLSSMSGTSAKAGSSMFI